MSDRQWRFFQIEGGDTAFVETINTNLIAILQYNLGRRLFDRIERTGRTYRIQYVPNTFNSKDSFNLFTTNDPRMLCDPHYLSSTDFEPTVSTVRQRRKTFIYYWHELVHGLHVAEGTWRAWDAEEEFRTVGLYNYQSDTFTENTLRQRAGLPRRPVYCWIGDRQDVLRVEMQRRKRYGLPENPRQYLVGAEDDFNGWRGMPVRP
jgi:hypothetical protein